MSRRWAVRAGVLVLVTGAAFGLLRLLERDPDPPRLALLSGLTCLALWMVFDLLTSTTSAAPLDVEHGARTRDGAVDAHTDSLTRIIEAHLQSRTPDGQVRARLADLADQRLAQRHGVRLGDQEAQELLGRDAHGLLADPGGRLSLPQIQTTLSRIEEL